MSFSSLTLRFVPTLRLPVSFPPIPTSMFDRVEDDLRSAADDKGEKVMIFSRRSAPLAERLPADRRFCKFGIGAPSAPIVELTPGMRTRSKKPFRIAGNPSFQTG